MWRQLDFLEERGWQHLPLRDIVERCRCGLDDDRNEYCITFDDAYRSVYQVAFPALQQHDMTATVYVPVGSIGGPITWDGHPARRTETLMTADQIRDLAQTGFEIGSHTISHARLTQLTDKELRRELAGSKAMLEDITGTEVLSLSYPYGACDQRVLEESVRAGYKYAVSTKLATLTPGTNLYDIPRISVRWNTIGAVLLRNIAHAYLGCHNGG